MEEAADAHGGFLLPIPCDAQTKEIANEDKN
jgi:hypothetical protein